MRKISLMALTLSLVTSLSALSAHAYGEAHYENGARAYLQGNYNVARVELFAYVKSHPGQYQAHYQLANALTALCEFDLAQTHYQKTLQFNPDKVTAQRARAAIAQIAYVKMLPPSQKPISIEERQQRQQAYDMEKSMAMMQEQSKRLEDQKAQITKDAERQATAVLADAQNQVQELKNTSNYRVRTVSGDFVGTGVPDRMATDMLAPAQLEAQKIREAAAKKAASLSLPASSSGYYSQSRNFIGNTPGKNTQ